MQIQYLPPYPEPHICASESVQMMDCRLFAAKPLSELKQGYRQLDP